MVNKPGLSWIILIVLSLVWGSSFILMKLGMEAFSSDEVAALRISLAFLSLLPFLPFHFKKLSLKKNWKGLILMGAFGNLVPAFLFTKAETQISSSLTGMINSLTPLFTVLFGILIFKQKLQKNKLIGILIGMTGTVCLLSFGESSESSKNLYFAFMVVAATFFYAISVNGIRYYLQDINSFTAAIWSFSLIGPFALGYLLLGTEFTSHLSHHEKGWSSFGFVSILAVVGTSASVIAFNYLIKLAGTVFASSCTYLIPIIAIMWGIVFGESITLMQVFSMGIIILGVWLLNRK